MRIYGEYQSVVKEVRADGFVRAVLSKRRAAFLRICAGQSLGLRDLNFTRLQNEYLSLTGTLNKIYWKVKERSAWERAIESKIDLNSNLKIHTGFWIGNRNVDIFIPALRANGHDPVCGKGLVIEVNGGIHNQPGKMNKDGHLADTLHELGVMHTSIENQDLNKVPVRYFLNNLNGIRRLDWRGRNRLLRRIYLYTLFAHLSDTQLSTIFGAGWTEIAKWSARSGVPRG